jgi:hypothetical protein
MDWEEPLSSLTEGSKFDGGSVQYRVRTACPQQDILFISQRVILPHHLCLLHSLAPIGSQRRKHASAYCLREYYLEVQMRIGGKTNKRFHEDS